MDYTQQRSTQLLKQAMLIEQRAQDGHFIDCHESKKYSEIQKELERRHQKWLSIFQCDDA